MRYVLLLALVCFVGCEHRPFAPVDATFLQAQMVEDTIEVLDESQWAGDAENAISGSTDLFDTAWERARETYPTTQEYFQHIGCDTRIEPGYQAHSIRSWGGYWRQIYVKE